MNMTYEQFVEIVEEKGGIVHGKPAVWKNVDILFKNEKPNSFFFEKNSKVRDLTIVDYGGGNRYELGESSVFTGRIKIGRDCQVIFKDKITITGGLYIHISDKTRLFVGSDCMLGVGVAIYTHDYHPIFSLETGNRLNLSKDVVIENKVWVGNNAQILKGVTIGSGSVIATSTLLVKNVPKNSIAAGNPAKIVKTNVIWSRDSFNTSHLDGIEHIKETINE